MTAQPSQPLPNESRPFASGRVLIVALQGWNDAGEAASSAVAELREQLDASEVVASLDGDDFFDYTVTRPRIETGADGAREIVWPGATVAHAAADDRVFTLTGVEPSFRWRQYAEEIIAACERLDIASVVLVGALLADAPHTRDIEVFRTSDDKAVQQEFDIAASQYEGPTGALSAIGARARSAEMRVMSMWASVPHYAQTPEVANPKATLAVLTQLAQLLGIEAATDRLREEAEVWETRVTEAVAADDELRGYVEYLEHTRDVVDSEQATGEAIAAEFERFLAGSSNNHPSRGGHAARGDRSVRGTDDDGEGERD